MLLRLTKFYIRNKRKFQRKFKNSNRTTRKKEYQKEIRIFDKIGHFLNFNNSTFINVTFDDFSASF